jgi:hypothetical protein
MTTGVSGAATSSKKNLMDDILTDYKSASYAMSGDAITNPSMLVSTIKEKKTFMNKKRTYRKELKDRYDGASERVEAAFNEIDSNMYKNIGAYSILSKSLQADDEQSRTAYKTIWSSLNPDKTVPDQYSYKNFVNSVLKYKKDLIPIKLQTGISGGYTSFYYTTDINFNLVSNSSVFCKFIFEHAMLTKALMPELLLRYCELEWVKFVISKPIKKYVLGIMYCDDMGTWAALPTDKTKITAITDADKEGSHYNNIETNGLKYIGYIHKSAADKELLSDTNLPAHYIQFIRCANSQLPQANVVLKMYTTDIENNEDNNWEYTETTKWAKNPESEQDFECNIKVVPSNFMFTNLLFDDDISKDMKVIFKMRLPNKLLFDIMLDGAKNKPNTEISGVAIPQFIATDWLNLDSFNCLKILIPHYTDFAPFKTDFFRGLNYHNLDLRIFRSWIEFTKRMVKIIGLVVKRNIKKSNMEMFIDLCLMTKTIRVDLLLLLDVNSPLSAFYGLLKAELMKFGLSEENKLITYINFLTNKDYITFIKDFLINVTKIFDFRNRSSMVMKYPSVGALKKDFITALTVMIQIFTPEIQEDLSLVLSKKAIEDTVAPFVEGSLAWIKEVTSTIVDVTSTNEADLFYEITLHVKFVVQKLLWFIDELSYIFDMSTIVKVIKKASFEDSVAEDILTILKETIQEIFIDPILDECEDFINKTEIFLQSNKSTPLAKEKYVGTTHPTYVQTEYLKAVVNSSGAAKVNKKKKTGPDDTKIKAASIQLLLFNNFKETFLPGFEKSDPRAIFKDFGLPFITDMKDERFLNFLLPVNMINFKYIWRSIEDTNKTIFGKNILIKYDTIAKKLNSAAINSILTKFSSNLNEETYSTELISVLMNHFFSIFNSNRIESDGKTTDNKIVQMKLKEEKRKKTFLKYKNYYDRVARLPELHSDLIKDGEVSSIGDDCKDWIMIQLSQFRLVDKDKIQMDRFVNQYISDFQSTHLAEFNLLSNYVDGLIVQLGNYCEPAPADLMSTKQTNIEIIGIHRHGLLQENDDLDKASKSFGGWVSKEPNILLYNPYSYIKKNFNLLSKNVNFQSISLSKLKSNVYPNILIEQMMEEDLGGLNEDKIIEKLRSYGTVDLLFNFDKESLNIAKKKNTYSVATGVTSLISGLGSALIPKKTVMISTPPDSPKGSSGGGGLNNDGSVGGSKTKVVPKNNNVAAKKTARYMRMVKDLGIKPK